MSNIKNQVAIINLGTELTQGFTQNTNAHWISGRLRDMGFDTAYQIALPDSADTWNSTWNMIREAGVHIVIIGGGLGPTADDKTRDLIAKTLNRPLIYHPEWEEPIKLWFTSRGKPYSASNQIQACFPEGALVLDNPVGTAPGFQITHEGITLFATPGVPSEAKTMFERHIAPWLLAQGAPKFFTKETRLAEITESDLELVLRKVDFTEDVSWSSLPVKDSLILRMYSHKSPEILETVQARFEKALGEKAHSIIVSRDGKNMVQVIMELLNARHEMIATAESCTGGLIASEIVSESGSSAIFAGSIVAYQNEVKTQLLGVPSDLIEQYGAVSEPVVTAMAKGAQQAFHCDWAVATSGIAGPHGGTEEKPVGLTWMAIATPNKIFAFQEKFLGNREQIRLKCVYRVLSRLRIAILEQKITCTSVH